MKAEVASRLVSSKFVPALSTRGEVYLTAFQRFSKYRGTCCTNSATTAVDKVVLLVGFCNFNI